MFWPAARARRGSLWATSRIRWSLVYEWIVFIRPRRIVNLSWTTLAAGARQFVVQLALLMIWCWSGSYLPSLTPEHDRDVLALRRGADDDLLRAGVDVGARLVGVGEQAGRLDHDVDAEVAPRQLGRVLDLEDLDRLAVDDDRVVGVADVALVGAVRRVVLEQQGVGRDVDEVVDGDDLDTRRALEHRLEGLAADAAEAVDSDADGHRGSSLDRDGVRSGAVAAAPERGFRRTAGPARSGLPARTGDDGVGSAAAAAGVAAAAATPRPDGVPGVAGRSVDRCSWRPVLDRIRAPRSMAGAGRADRCVTSD